MPSGAKKRKKEKAAAKRREDEELGITHQPTPQSPTNPQDKELEQGFVMERSENNKELLPSHEVASPPLIAKEVVESSEALVGALQIPISSVEDVGIVVEEVVEGKEEVGEASVCARATEVSLEHKLSEEGSMDPVTEQLLEAGEAQDSVPTSSLIYESEEGEECEGGVPNMGTIIAITPTEDSDGRPPQLEHRVSLWNCCGLLDVFKNSRG